jgi:hypothetical protein
VRFNWFKKKPSAEKTRPEGVLKKYDLASLKEALKDGNEKTRISAAQTIGKFCGKNAISPLREALKDTSAQVRQYAAESLGMIEYGRDLSGRLESRDVFNALKPLLKDANSDVRTAAEEAREKIVEKNPSLKPEDVKGKEDGQLSGKTVVTLGKYKASWPEDYFKSSVDKEAFDPTKCALCGKKRSENEMRSVGEKDRVRSFCLDTCWSKRGQIIGSKLESARQCQYYSEGMCTASGDHICSLQFGTYNSSCFVYRMKRTGAI